MGYVKILIWKWFPYFFHFFCVFIKIYLIAYFCLFIHFYSRDDLEVNRVRVLAVLISVELPLFWNNLCLILILIVIILHSVSLFFCFVLFCFVLFFCFFFVFFFFFSKTLHHQFISKEDKTFSVNDFRLVRFKAIPAIALPIELTN